MGSSSSKPSENNYMEQIKSINIDDLDLSKIDALQLKAFLSLSWPHLGLDLEISRLEISPRKLS